MLQSALIQATDMPNPDAAQTRELARQIRFQVLHMVHRARASHVGSCLSIADLLAVLYGGVLRVEPKAPAAPLRDRFILSKGHAAAALYAVLSLRGFFPSEWLERYCENGSPLAGHVQHKGVPGVEFSTGSLGHGLSVGLGMALAATAARPYGVFVLLSDGECDEGAVWEAALLAGHHKLHHLIAIVDYNKIQSLGRVKDVLNLEPFADKWQAFGWHVQQVDGHDHHAIANACAEARAHTTHPSVILAHTLKGKGVSFMEDDLAWHYRSPTDAELDRALRELEGTP